MEGGRELTCRIIEPIAAASMMSIVSTLAIWLFFFFKPAFLDVFEFGLDITENRQAGQVTESAPLVGELLWLNHVDLSENQHKRTSIINESSI